MVKVDEATIFLKSSIVSGRKPPYDAPQIKRIRKVKQLQKKEDPWEDPFVRNSVTLKDARQFCTRLAEIHYENFPVGRWVRKELRPHVHTIYAFARMADDFADEAQHTGKRLERLSKWRENLFKAKEGKADHPVFIALADTIEKFDIPLSWLDDLIKAFELDVQKNRHPDFESLISYAQCSANPVGRLVLWIHGYRDEKLFLLSDAICSALQFANFWQDIAVDWKKDRVYLPSQDMKKFGYAEADLEKGIVNQAFCNLLQFEMDRTWELFLKGRLLCDLVDGRLKPELRLVWCGGTRILEKIKEANFDVFQKRPQLERKDKALMLWRTLTWKKDAIA